MIRLVTACILAALTAQLALASDAPKSETTAMQTDSLYDPIAEFLQDRAGEFDQISESRREQLEELSAYIARERSAGRPIRLIFVCTHNSRRSHMSQLWAAAAAEAFGIEVSTYSGGTEDTAFNPRAVAAMKRAGFDIDKTTEGRNPVYHVRMGRYLRPMTCFSKAYHNPPNPDEGFAAVMVCTSADEACPVVPGASGRFAIPFVDPKVSDNTPAEAATYDERCAQIAREMLYVMSKVER